MLYVESEEKQIPSQDKSLEKLSDFGEKLNS